MKVFVCKICGEVYIGSEIPHTCPFCGAENKYLTTSRSWNEKIQTFDIEINPVEKKYLTTSLKLEIDNTAFYRCAFETLSDKEFGLLFKGLSKVENEHASVFRKFLKPKKDPVVKTQCKNDVDWCIEQSLIRERRAVALYKEAIKNVTHPRLKQAFKAIMMVEKDHITIDREMFKREAEKEKELKKAMKKALNK